MEEGLKLPGNLQDILQHAQQLQQNVSEMQAELQIFKEEFPYVNLSFVRDTWKPFYHAELLEGLRKAGLPEG